MKYRNVSFDVEIVGFERWRWTIHPPRATGLTFVGQVVGTESQAIVHCKSEIEMLLERELPIDNFGYRVIGGP